METDVDVEILKTRIPTSTCKTPAGVLHSSHRPGGDHNNLTQGWAKSDDQSGPIESSELNMSDARKILPQFAYA